MPFLGTIVNFGAVLICGILGTLVKKGVPKHIGEALTSAIAICMIYIGIDGTLAEAPAVSGDFFSAGLVKFLVMLVSIVIGTLIGEIIDIDKWMNKLGAYAEKKLSRGEQNGKFAKAFVSCTLLFCVGAMAVNGSIQDAIGNHDLLLAKAVVDGISVFIMASTLGIGCAFSAFMILFYQGAVTLITIIFSAAISAATLTYISATGSLVIILIGFNVLGISQVKTANMTPAVFMPLIFGPLFQLIM